jgi:dienelactone hydrolase
MTAVVLFHHVQGLTAGIRRFAEELREAGHTVHTPDLMAGQTFATLDDGMAHARQVGFDTLCARGVDAVADLPNELVYAGFSLGVMPAQQLAQTRPGARGALFFDSCLPTSEFGSGWPEGVPVQVHGMTDDEYFAGEDLDAAKALVDGAEDGELFLYPGNVHLFADSSLASYDAEATALLARRVLDFLGRL